MIALLAACSGGDPVPADCMGPDCVDTLASARLYAAPHDSSVKLGDELAALGDLVLVGAPSYPVDESFTGRTYVTALALPGFGPVATWFSATQDYDELGAALAIADVDGDGQVEIAVGQPFGQPEGDVEGVVYVLAGTGTTGRIDDRAQLEFRTPEHIGGGQDVHFGSVVPPLPIALVVSGPGDPYVGDPGSVYALDPNGTGIVGEEAALRILRGGFGFGYRHAVWDVDLDGQDDLVVGERDASVQWFLGPWVSAATDADRDGRWMGSSASDGLAQVMETVGDVTGDGAADLGFTAFTHLEPNERAGRAYVVAGGDTEERPVDDLPLQVRGIAIGEGMGTAIAGGDVDGDGQDDLVVGASGVTPGVVPGWVYLFRGPITGTATYDRTTADAVLEGEHDLDFFGRSLAIVDDDGDAQADLVIGATGWPSGAYGGAVYLVRGASWVR